MILYLSHPEWELSIMDDDRFYWLVLEATGIEHVMVWVRNVSHKLPYLNTLSPTYGGVWKGSKTFWGRHLLEELCHWAWALRIYRLSWLPVLSLLPNCWPNVDSQPHTYFFCDFPVDIEPIPLKRWAKINPSLLSGVCDGVFHLSCHLSQCFITAIGKKLWHSESTDMK